MKQLLILLVFFTFYSCIPLRIAPNIKEDKVMVAKKFKRKLPRRNAFIFEDPKNAEEFYNYINTKYELNHIDVGWNVPITIEGEKLFLTYYEIEIPTKTINLIPILIDVGLESNGYDPLLADAEFSRIGNWYLVLTVTDSDFNDCLKPSYKFQKEIIKYLRSLRIEYLNTHEYVQVLLKKKS